jgi:hypothetical protein
MDTRPTKPLRQQGRFVKGQSGNPRGRPKGSTGHATELRRSEEDGLKLATNVADVIAETARLSLLEIELPEFIPLIDAITKAAKRAIMDGEFGPSSVAMLRGWYDDHLESEPGGAFFVHVGLPKDCSWKVFREHYTTRKRIDHSRHAEDLESFPPIAKAIADLKSRAA